MNDLTFLTVTYNTPELLARACHSVRQFHDEPMIIINGGNDLYGPGVVHVGYNIGHGRGMVMGISLIRTKYALIFDTDIVMLKSPVKEMLALMQPDTFGVGWIQDIGRDGYDFGAFKHHKERIKYLHPYFHLINVENYHKYHPYVHHGAPCYKTMVDIHDRGLSDKILISFAGLTGQITVNNRIVGAPSEYVLHDFGGTRMANKQSGNEEIELGWTL